MYNYENNPEIRRLGTCYPVDNWFGIACARRLPLVVLSFCEVWFGIACGRACCSGADYLAASERVDQPPPLACARSAFGCAWGHGMGSFPGITPSCSSETPVAGARIWGIASPGWILAGLAGLFWWVALLHKAPAPAWPKWVAGLVFPLLAAAALAGFLSGLRFLVTTATHGVAYENLLQAGMSGWTVFLIAGLGLQNLYLFSQWALQAMRARSPELPARVLLFAVVSSVMLIPSVSGWTGLSPVPAALFGFSYLLLFDLFLDYRNSGLAWSLVWALFFALLSAAMIARYRQEKDIRVLQDRAQKALSEGLPQEKKPTNRLYVFFLEKKGRKAPGTWLGSKKAAWFRSWAPPTPVWRRHLARLPVFQARRIRFFPQKRLWATALFLPE
ncbi:MAG: hypothetical protein IPK21_06550 [Haliscomenobacter sp.]|nr:hypothetical protein [Haliscomenobacter sp.]